jgi:hypothetical protein
MRESNLKSNATLNTLHERPATTDRPPKRPTDVASGCEVVTRLCAQSMTQRGWSFVCCLYTCARNVYAHGGDGQVMYKNKSITFFAKFFIYAFCVFFVCCLYSKTICMIVAIFKCMHSSILINSYFTELLYSQLTVSQFLRAISNHHQSCTTIRTGGMRYRRYSLERSLLQLNNNDKKMT